MCYAPGSDSPSHPAPGGQFWNLMPARETLVTLAEGAHGALPTATFILFVSTGMGMTAAGAATRSGHLHLSVMLLGGILVSSPKASASPEPLWECSSVESAWAKHRCPIATETKERNEVLPLLTALTALNLYPCMTESCYFRSAAR